MGRNKGGFVYIQTNKRERPFKILAARTIGYERKGIKPIGLEGAYDSLLEGRSGQRLMRKVAGGVWMPINNENEVEPQDGCDLHTTIDINIQDVAEHALLTQLKKHNAGYGCVILMEVKTGEIKAIANLSRKDSGQYAENYNNAIGSSMEPGSTFKLASLMAAMEDGYIDLDDKVDLENGTFRFYDRIMRDSHEPEERKVTIKRVFEISSNVGVAKTIWKYYSANPQKFVDRICSFGLNTPLGLSLPGEGRPRIKSTKDKDWSGVTLPWMSHGYEVLLTPIQILTFYNAVANGGRMVKPLFVREVTKRGKVICKYETEVLNEAICSKKTIDMAQEMLEGVVQNGTAKNLRAAAYRVAGKTGTAQIANKGTYKNGSRITYQASFAGYFPADNPKYSCIVVVNAPSNEVYYGNVVAGPIFKEIADKVYASSLEIHKPVNADERRVKNIPLVKNGLKEETDKVLTALAIPVSLPEDGSAWLEISRPDSARLQVKTNDPDRLLKKGLVPDLRGFTLSEAIFLLENNGIRVQAKGRGKIIQQSIPAGTVYIKGTGINLILSDS
jgi:cell division protein FtsI (penicillin-binding protein 3)